MAEQMRPASKEQAPDPASSYERAKPHKEAGMGRLDNNNAATPTRSPDSVGKAVKNQQNPEHQINAHDVVNERASRSLETAHGSSAAQPDHSMNDEEPMGSDQAPLGAMNPRDKRHPKTEGKGGTA